MMRRLARTGLRLVLALVAVGATGAASAAGPEAPKKPAPVKVAIMPLETAVDAAPKGLQGVSDILASELSRRGIEVVTAEDIKHLLGFQAQRQLLHCGDDACLASIGGALGVDVLVGGQISRLGHTWVLSVSALRIRDAQEIKRLSLSTRREGGLVTLAAKAADAIAAAVLPKAAGAVATVAPAPPSGGGQFPWHTVGLGAGIVAFAGGGLLYATGWMTHGTFAASQGPSPQVTWPEARAARTRAGIGLGLAGLGVALAVTSLLLHHPAPATGLDASAATPAGALVAVAPVRGGAVALFELRGLP